MFTKLTNYSQRISFVCCLITTAKHLSSREITCQIAFNRHHVSTLFKKNTTQILIALFTIQWRYSTFCHLLHYLTLVLQGMKSNKIWKYRAIIRGFNQFFAIILESIIKDVIYDILQIIFKRK